MTDKKGLRVILVLGVFSLLSALAGSSTSLAIPKIALSLGVSSSGATWVLQIGLITTTIFLVAFGHFGDILSKNCIFLAGGLIFTVGSAITGIAPTLTVILIGRVIQSVGSAMIMANSMGIVSDYFADSKRAEALSYISMFISVGSISGPSIGGFIMSVASWRWIYLINVPLMLLIIVFGMKVLPVPKEKASQVLTAAKGVNWLGQSIFSVGVILFFLSGLIFQDHSQTVIAFLVLAVGAALIFYSFVQDDRAKTPWIAPQILHNRRYMVSITALLLVMLVNSVSNVLLPFYLQSYSGLSPFNSGLIIMIQPIVMLIFSPISGYLADHFDRQLMTTFGLVILAFSQIGYIMYPGNLDFPRIILPIVLNGFGMAFFLSPNNALTMGLVPKDLSGIAGSLNSFARTIGTTVGVSFSATLLFFFLPGVTHITPQVGPAFMHAFAIVFFGAFVISIIAAIIVANRYISSLRAARKSAKESE